MTFETSSAAQPRKPMWADLSERHAKARERLEVSLAAFRTGNPAKVLSIIGPYGSGKSELMTWGFHHSWTKLDMPALFVNLETLLDALPQTLSPAHLVDEIANFITYQLKQIDTSLEQNPRPNNVHLSTDVRPNESFLAYLRQLFDDSALSAEHVRKLLTSGRAVLFLDEIEQKYAALTARVSADDRAPFREVFQSIEQGRTQYYLVGSFGLTSAYESVSDADTRRQESILLPIPDVARMILPSEASPYRNFLWWASRGRPGWAYKFAVEWPSLLATIERLDEFGALPSNTIDTLPIVDVNSQGDLMLNSRQSKAFTALVKNMRPCQLTAIPGYQSPDEDISRLLGSYSFVIAPADEDARITVDEFCDALLEDLRLFAVSAKLSAPNLQILISYLRQIIRAMADSDDTIILGAWRQLDEWATHAVIVPLLVMLQDFLLEFEGDRDEIVTILNLIDRVFAESGVIGDQIEDTYKLTLVFDHTMKLFQVVRTLRSGTYVVAPSPRAIEGLFPRMVGRPLLMMDPTARGSINEQRAAVEANAVASGRFLNTVAYQDELEVRVLFVPDTRSLRQLQERLFSRHNRSVYLAHDRVYALVPLMDEIGKTLLDPALNSDLRILQRLKKVQWHDLGERRTQDFLVSFWYNLLLIDRSDQDLPDALTMLDTLATDQKRSKSQRRQLAYYRNRLNQKIQSIVQQAAQDYRIQRRQFFDPQSSSFPQRLSETLANMSEARAIEQVAMAFDVSRERQTSLDLLFSLRQMDHLKPLPKSPHGYQQFLETSAAVRSGRDEIRPALPLDELVNYLQSYNLFTDLIEVATDLGLDPGADWTLMPEGTEKAPLLQLFGALSEPGRIFLRGVSFQSYLTQCSDTLREQVKQQHQEAKRLYTALTTLQEQIRVFNQQLGSERLSAANLDLYTADLDKLQQQLEISRNLRPAVLYVLYRFSQAAIKALDELRQRWSGDNGLEGWRSQCHNLLRWHDNHTHIKAEVDALYAQDTALKIQLLGPQEQWVTRLQSILDGARLDVLRTLDLSYSIADKIPTIDMTIYGTALRVIESELAALSANADKVAHLAEHLASIHDRVGQVIEQLQVSHE